MKKTPLERLRAKSRTPEDGCWEVIKPNNKGYTQFYVDGKYPLVHRWSYEHFVGPIPEGLVIDHLCNNNDCWRPDHLEPVSQKVNVRRGEATAASETHCANNHEFTPETTYIYPNGDRDCRVCRRASQKKYRSAALSAS